MELKQGIRTMTEINGFERRSSDKTSVYSSRYSRG
jgi:hypothetical protein